MLALQHMRYSRRRPGKKDGFQNHLQNLHRTLPTPTTATCNKPLEKKTDWKDTKSELLDTLSPPSSSIDSNILFVTLSSFPKETSVKTQVEALLDSGSLTGNFISEKTVNKFHFSPNQTNSKWTVCSGLDSEYQNWIVCHILQRTFN